MWDRIKAIGRWARDIWRLHRRVKALEEWVAKQGAINAEAREEAKREAEHLCANIRFVDGAVYLREAIPGRDTGPYCPTCWRPPDPGTLVRLHTVGYGWEECDEERHVQLRKQKWACGVCNTQVDLWDH